MGLMDNMMNGMIKALPAEERKELMLKMMPDIMKDVDMVKMMPEMMKKLGQLITLYGIFHLIDTAIRDEELKDILKFKLEKLKSSMPGMMDKMHPMMEMMMPALMPKMMGFMTPMMPVMAKHMPDVMTNKMVPMLEKNPQMREHMLTMMQTMFPHCAINMFPLIEKEKRTGFVNRMYGLMAESAGKEMDDNEKMAFIEESQKSIKKNIQSKN